MKMQEATEIEATAIKARYDSVIGASTDIEMTMAAFMIARNSMSLIVDNAAEISDESLAFAAMEAMSNAVEEAREFLKSEAWAVLEHKISPTIN